MRLKLDENLGTTAAELFRSAGHETETVRDEGLSGADDRNIIAACQDEQRCNWPWSSAKAHLSAADDRLVAAAPLLAIIDDWRAFLDSAIPEKQLDQLRDHGRTGRPLGDATFLQRLEELIGRILLPRKPGRKPKFPK